MEILHYYTHLSVPLIRGSFETIECGEERERGRGRECVCVWGREDEEGGRVRRERGSSCSSCLDKNDVIDLVFPAMRGRV